MSEPDHLIETTFKLDKQATLILVMALENARKAAQARLGEEFFFSDQRALAEASYNHLDEMVREIKKQATDQHPWIVSEMDQVGMRVTDIMSGREDLP